MVDAGREPTPDNLAAKTELVEPCRLIVGDPGAEHGLPRSGRELIALELLDMTMPRLSGHETLKELRRIRESVTVILSSGYSEEVARDHFADQPISGFLQKPYTPNQLLARVQAALGDPSLEPGGAS